MMAEDRMTIRVNPLDRHRWEAKAESEGRSLSNWVNQRLKLADRLEEGGNFDQPHQGPRGKKRKAA